MQIRLTEYKDIAQIFEIYNFAAAYQRQNATRAWLGFEQSLIAKEIEENRHWAIVENDTIVATFVFTMQDAAIWGEKDAEPSLYIHRIAVHPDFRGRGYVKHIVDFARQYAASHHRTWLRMDTGAGNPKLINYYKSCGFSYLGDILVAATPDLPAHYQNNYFSLFEMPVESVYRRVHPSC